MWDLEISGVRTEFFSSSFSPTMSGLFARATPCEYHAHTAVTSTVPVPRSERVRATMPSIWFEGSGADELVDRQVGI